MSGIGSHHRAYCGKSDVWLTPPEIIESLGEFDLDPCSLNDRPWNTAKEHISPPSDGLSVTWRGRVWLNPPYGPETGRWLSKLADHGNGIALIFARTETDAFFRNVWEKSDAVLFIRGRLHFHRPDGSRAKCNSGGPSALVAYGDGNVAALKKISDTGHLVIIHRDEQAR